MADFFLNVHIDVDESYKAMSGEITTLINRLNQDPHLIKIQLDPASVKEMQTTIDGMLKQISSISAGLNSRTGIKLGTGASSMSREIESIRSGTNELIKRTQEYRKESENATRATETWKDSLTGTVTQINQVANKNGELVTSSRRVTDTYKTEAEAARDAARAQQELANVKKQVQTVLSSISAKQRSLQNVGGENTSYYSALNSYSERANALLGSYQQNPDLSKFRLELTTLQTELIKTTSDIDAYIAAQKASNSVAQESVERTYDKTSVENTYSKTLTRTENAINQYTSAEHSKNVSSRIAYQRLKDMSEELRKAYTEYKNGSISVNDFAKRVEAASIQVAKSTSTIKTNGDATKSLSDRLGNLAKKFGSWLTVSQVIMYTVRSIRKMITASVEVDSALTQMQIVTKASKTQMNEFADSAADAAKRIGSSITDFVDSATTYARLGYSMDESGTLAEFTAMLQNVGDIEVGDAQNAITSIIKAFDIDANEIESVMDKLVVTGNNFPISVSQIAEGMTNASSTLSAAGNSFEESVALLTAANTTIQDAAKASTGLRTIAARIRNTKAELDDLGEVMTEASYEELVGILTDCNVALTEVNGEYRSTYAIMSDIAAQWEHMTSMEQAALATALSGTRQQAVFYSIIEQFQEASGAMAAMENSTGALQAAYDTYLESVKAHIDQFKAAFQELSADIFQSDLLNFFIDAGKIILNVVDGLFKLINALGGLKTALTVVAGVTLSTKILGTSFIEVISRIPTVLNSFNSGTALAVQGTSRFSAVLKGLGISAGAAQSAFAAFTIILTAAVLVYNRVKQAHDDMVERANDAIKEFNDASAAIDGYKEKIQSLKESLDSGNLSQEEAYEVRKQLLSIQDEIKSAYGSEAEAIDLIKMSADEATQSLNGLTSALANKNLTENYRFIQKAIKHIEAVEKYSISLGYGNEIDDEAASAIRDIVDKYEYATISHEYDRDTGLARMVINVEADAENAKDTVDGLAADFRTLQRDFLNIGVDISDIFPEYDNVNKRFETTLGQINDIFKDYGNIYNQQILWKIATDVDYSEAMDEIDSANTAMQKAVSEEYDSDTERAVALADAVAQVKNAQEKFGELTFGQDDNGVKKYLQNIISDLQEEADRSQIKINIIADIDGESNGWMETVKENLNVFADENGEVHAVSILDVGLGFENGNTDNISDEKIRAYHELVSAADAYGVELESLLGILGKYGYVISATNGLNESAKISFDRLISDDSEGSFMSQVDGYVSSVQKLQSALDDYRDGGIDNPDLYDLINDFPALAGHSEDLGNAIAALIEELTGGKDELGNFTGIYAIFMEQFGKLETDEDKEKLLELLGIVTEFGRIAGSTSLSIDIKAETSSVQNLLTALKESVSATGLTEESIESLKERYQDLEGYDASRLFEKTANGIHLNTTELRKLEKEYKHNRKTQYITELQKLESQYNDLTDKINKAGNAASKSDLYAQRARIKEQIDDISMLAAQYDGLTSSFYEWEQAQQTSDADYMYESLSNSLESIKELYDEGRIGVDDFRAAVQLMTDVDVSNLSPDELVAIYEPGIRTMERFFTGGKDGLVDFLNVAKDVSEALGKDWVTLDEDNNWHFDFGVGGDAEVAKAISEMTGLQISTQEVQMLLQAMEAYGAEIHLDSMYSAFDLAVAKGEEAYETLKEFGESEYTFDFTVNDNDSIDAQVEKAKEFLDTFKDADGNIDLSVDGAEEAKTVLKSLLEMKQSLNAPEIMRIDTDALESVDASLAEAVSAMVEFTNLSNDLAIHMQLGESTEETLTQLQAVVSTLQGFDDDVKAKLGLDTEEFNLALQNISEELDIDAGVTLNEEDMAIIQSAIDSLSVDQIELLTNSEEILQELKTIDEFEIRDKSFKVGVRDNASSILTKIKSLINSIPSTKTITVTTVESTSSKSGTTTGANASSGITRKGVTEANGTAHATGTAMVRGNWGTTNSGIALGGEVKQELVVRDGKFFTIGDKSAEFFRYQKGDIIFNGDQTEQIFKYGRIKTGNRRGKTFAHGTAFSNGVWSSSSSSVGSSSSSNSSSSSSSGSLSNSSSSDDDDSEIIDWIEIAIDRIERAINRLATIATSQFKKLSDRLKATNDEMLDMAYEISVQRAGYDRYIQQANSVGLSSSLAERVRNGTIDINEYDGDTAERIRDYQEWYEKALDCADAIQELTESIAGLYQNKFDDIATDYENQLALLEHLTNTYNNGLDDLEERGYLASTKYYEAMQSVERQSIDIQKKELDSLIKAMSEAINSGYIEEGSEAWYEFQQSINDVKEAIQESETAVIEFANAIRELKWEHFDYLQERISAITDEADFLIDLLEYSDLYTDNGQLTDSGMAAMGLHGQNYNVYMAQADKYAEELLKLNAEIANDPNNTKLLERREELLEAQRDAIIAAEDEKQAIVDMVREGIELELSALQELITSYTDALDSAKSLYDYQKKVKDQTSEIAKLQKQLAAYSGDTSEEARATRQRLEVDLADAMESLEETQYENYISEQKKLLDNLYDEYETILNQRLDDIEALISDMIDRINASSKSISDTILDATDNVGYTISDEMRGIWSDNNNRDIMTKYGESFSSALTSIKNVLDSISLSVSSMIASSDSDASETIDSASSTTATDTSVTPTTSKDDTSSTPSTPSTTPSTSATTSKPTLAIGKYVYLKPGTKWYSSSDGQKPTGNADSWLKGRSAKISHINTASWATHPYAIENYGWVKKTDIVGYSTGGLVDSTGIAWLDGTPKKPELVLNSSDSQNFIALKDAMRSVANGDSPLASLFGGGDASMRILEELAKIDAPIGAQSTNIGDITYEVNIPIDHVADYEDFMNQMRKDGKFEKLLQSMTVDRMAGRSRLAKNRYQW